MFERGVIDTYTLRTYIIKTYNTEKVTELRSLLDEDEQDILDFVIYRFRNKESKKCKTTSDNAVKLLKVSGHWVDGMDIANVATDYNKLSGVVYAALRLIRENSVTADIVRRFKGIYNLSILIEFAIFLDSVDLIKKLIPRDDRYVQLKYHYHIDDSTEIKKYFEQIDLARQEDKKKVNELLKNTKYHVDAINDGELVADYERKENVFGMTPDDNIMAKLLLLYNKVFNKRDKLNDKDKTTLVNMRKAVHNIRRDNVFNRVSRDYFYSHDLHDLFFTKKDTDEKFTPTSQPTKPVTQYGKKAAKKKFAKKVSVVSSTKTEPIVYKTGTLKLFPQYGTKKKAKRVPTKRAARRVTQKVDSGSDNNSLFDDLSDVDSTDSS
jgi:hypothetical protein